ncbi:MAG: class I adenylate-forming enzyme family protein [Verrucomicrobiota bacterium]
MDAENIIARISAHAPMTAPAIFYPGGSMTYGHLMELAERTARWLCVRPGFPGTGGRIGLACPNGPRYIVLALGILASGACLVPIAEELTKPERDDLAARTFLDAVLTDCTDDPAASLAAENWCPMNHPPFPQEQEFRALSPAFVRFSSGTTGVSKGVVLSHHSLAERVIAANEALRIGESDRVLWLLPMAHHFAVSIILYLFHGAATVLPASTLAVDVLASARATDATVIYASPFHHALLAADHSGQPWPSLRLAISTAAALTEETAGKFHERFDVPLVQGLGIIEVGLPVLNHREPLAHPTAIGNPLPAYEVALRGGASANEGELHIRGPGMFDAYFSPWKTRAEASPDGWFSTGDIASRLPDGRLILRGRNKSVINVNGMKVFPEEVEHVLNGHPAVAASMVIATPHAVFGAVLEARIVAADSAALPAKKDLVARCHQALSAYKIPARFRFVDELPRTANGKLLRTS